MVVELIDPVVNELEPVVRAIPPVEAAYQSIVSPAPGVAEIVTVPVPQREPLDATGATGVLLIVATTGVLVSEIHPEPVFLVWA